VKKVIEMSVGARSIVPVRYVFKIEPLTKLLKAGGSRHSGQAKRDPESSAFKYLRILWTRVFTEVTGKRIFGLFMRSSLLVSL